MNEDEKKIVKNFLKVKLWVVTATAFSLILLPIRVRADNIALFYALDADFKAFSDDAQPLGNAVLVGDRKVQRLSLHGHQIYAVRMESGAVESAVSAAALLARFHCALAFTIGPAGSLDPALKIGSWHEVSNVVAYQKGRWIATGFQTSTPSVADAFKTTQELQRLTFPSLLSAETKLTVASGQVFVALSSYHEQLRAATGANAVDMNLFGLQTACTAFNVPLFSWKVITDQADDHAGEAFRDFIEHYDGAGGRALAGIIKTLGISTSSPKAYPHLKQKLESPAPTSSE